MVFDFPFKVIFLLRNNYCAVKRLIAVEIFTLGNF